LTALNAADERNEARSSLRPHTTAIAKPAKSASKRSIVAEQPAPTSIPLVVDLDGTLVRTDTLWESFFAAWARNMWLPIATLFLLFRGRAALKQTLSARALDSRLTIATLPYNDAVLARVREARAQGRATVLATAADEKVANAVAAHLSLFDRVFASDGQTNLKAQRKTEKLVAEFGEKGFDYIGDSRADAPVWRAAREAFTVSSVQPSGVARIEEAAAPLSAIEAWTKMLRVRHWIKNVLVFVALFAAHRFAEAGAWQAAVATFVAFCAVCSGIYVFNDLFDLASDRSHPSKMKRPLARGFIALPAALFAAIALLACGLALAFFVGRWVGVALLAYCAVNALYTLKIKRIAVADVSVLAGLYTLRIVAGAVAIAAPLSPWLFAFSVFAFLSLALLKRAIDINRLAADETLSGRGYTGRDATFVNVFGAGASLAAVLVLALYIAAPQAAALYRNSVPLWFALAVVLYWLMRIWQRAMRGAMDDDPVLFATKDATSWLCVALIAACFVAAI
jgi:4-hydroxybenzoate polyprenyltransferase/phosphoglycolate phosphatase-like HAD superfamily hydrolase